MNKPQAKVPTGGRGHRLDIVHAVCRMCFRRRQLWASIRICERCGKQMAAVLKLLSAGWR